MTDLLAACAGVGAVLTAVTALLTVLPARQWELRIWRWLGVTPVRHWLTRRHREADPLDLRSVSRIARRNLQWHLALTGLFSVELAVAAGTPHAWWRPLALLLLLPCIAYMLGSVVQRQKIAIIQARDRRSRYRDRER